MADEQWVTSDVGRLADAVAEQGRALVEQSKSIGALSVQVASLASGLTVTVEGHGKRIDDVEEARLPERVAVLEVQGKALTKRVEDAESRKPQWPAVAAVAISASALGLTLLQIVL